ncbi:DUF2304 domain-containing protein [Alloiococcus sp. CFN-8]|uniref:DUF2304 domain-containing protein n=1 Tax=Alloiococcus sp. CFN-8 TaxID=3416081 RepID=UPI003CF3EA16
MMLKFRVILVMAVVLSFIYMYRLIVKGKLQLRYTLMWMLLGAAILLMAIFPKIVNAISEAIGVYDPTNAVFFFGFVFTLPLIFGLTLSLSNTSEKLRELTQEVALLKNSINSESKETEKEQS